MNLRKLYPKIALLLIVCLGFGLRMYKLTQAPEGALIDELHFGYLAHSLLETGKDEHGISYPIVFKGFGDQKLPAYAYITMPFVAFFGLEVIAFRMPSVLMGTALIVLLYWLALEVGLRKKWAVLIAFFAAVNPWSFFLSRIGFESNLALGFYVIGLAAFLRGIRQKSTPWLILGSLSFAATWYSYVAFRPVVGLLLLIVAAHSIWLKQLQVKQVLIALVVFAIAVAPLFGSSAAAANNARFKQVGILSDQGIALRIDENRTFCSMQFPRLLCDVAFNKGVIVTRVLLSRYLETFSPEFLTTRGEEDIIFLTVQEFGQIYPLLYPLFILGIVALFYNKKSGITKNGVVLIVAGLLLSPLPTILVGDPQKIRISALLPFIFILLGVGAAYLHELLEKKVFQMVVSCALVLGTTGYAYLYFVEYFTVHTVSNEHHYQSYLPDMYTFLNTLEEETLIVIKPFYSDPLMFYAFYSKMDPATYQEQAVLGELEDSGFQHTVELGRVWAYDYSLQHVGCIGHQRNQQAVFVTNEKVEGAKILYEGRSTNGVHPYVFVYDATASTISETCPTE